MDTQALAVGGASFLTFVIAAQDKPWLRRGGFGVVLSVFVLLVWLQFGWYAVFSLWAVAISTGVQQRMHRRRLQKASATPVLALRP
jgi:hypothetical protein